MILTFPSIRSVLRELHDDSLVGMERRGSSGNGTGFMVERFLTRCGRQQLACNITARHVQCTRNVGRNFTYGLYDTFKAFRYAGVDGRSWRTWGNVLAITDHLPYKRMLSTVSTILSNVRASSLR